MQMTLENYLTGRDQDGRSFFYAYIATLPNGGKVTAEYERDNSTEQHFRNMTDGQFLIAYNMPNGDHRRCQIHNGSEIVTLKKGI